MLLYHDGGYFNTSNYRHWSESAIMCYERGCQCSGCYIKEIMITPCMMKYAVVNLVKNIGKPPVKKEPFFEGITRIEEKIIEAILNGFETKTDIAQELNVNPAVIQYNLNSLYELAEQNGANYTKIRFKLPELVDFIKQKAREKKID